MATTEEKLRSGGFNIAGRWTSQLDPITGEGFIAKDVNNTASSVIGWQHASKVGYLLHFESRAGGKAPAAMIGIGLDATGPDNSQGVGGILIANKSYAHGLTIRNQPSIMNSQSYGLYLIQESMAPTMYGIQTPGTAELIRLQAGSGMTTEKIMTVIDSVGEAGNINSASGKLQWKRDITVAGEGSNRRKIEIYDNAQVVEAKRNFTFHHYNALEFLVNSGTDDIFYPRRLSVSGLGMSFDTASPITGRSTTPSYSKQFEVRHNQIGFFGTTPVSKRNGVAVTTEAIHAALVSYGLISA
ncbi:Uncharacterised protein [Mycobacteroides abscessus subsp. abscessus]|nr:Uncharacterised protein [Mycobacteroides abscessus subsp. abscessus]